MLIKVSYKLFATYVIRVHPEQEDFLTKFARGYSEITKETLVYRHSYLNPMSAVFDDVTNCDAGFD